MEFLIYTRAFNIMSKSNLLLCYYVSNSNDNSRYITAECLCDQQIFILISADAF